MSCIANPLTSCFSPLLPELQEQANWYAVYTNSRHEKTVADHLRSKNVEVFLPTLTVVSTWKDRKMKLDVPAFPSYVFTKIGLSERGKVLSVPGVVKILSFNGAPAAVDPREIESIMLCQQRGALIESRPLFDVGAKVRVKSGVLEGVEGFVSRYKDGQTLIVPLSLIGQSIVVQVDIATLEPLKTIRPYGCIHKEM